MATYNAGNEWTLLMDDSTIGELSNKKELAAFLRIRRERLSPADFGIEATRSRRTPGLRREEVAFLANIGVKWYASLEAGEDTNPSPKTLLAIAKALRLGATDTRYVFDLAGLSMPVDYAVDYTFEVPSQLMTALDAIKGAAAAIWDLLLTPLAWNAIFDGVMGTSRYPSPLERNLLVQGFGPSGFIQRIVGSDYERVLFNAVGVLRRYYTSGKPTPFAQQVYNRIKDSLEFQRAWEARTVSDEYYPGATVLREHPMLGALKMYPVNLYLPHREDIVFKIWLPADDATAKVFAMLEAAGMDESIHSPSKSEIPNISRFTNG